MRSFVMVVLLAAAAAAMQNSDSIKPVSTPAAPKTIADTKTPASTPAISGLVKGEPAASDPVITIHGLCSGAQSSKTADCATVVTKQQFDGVINSLNAIGPQLLPMQRRQVAEGYATTLLNYEAAKKAGVERDPRYAEVMRLARMRAMGDMYKAMQQEKAGKVSAQEIQDYYKNNLDKLEELTLRRVVLPRYNQANLKDEQFAVKARQLAHDVHDRMVKGEDLDQLEKEAYETLGVKNPPTTRMGIVRRGVYADEQEKQLFALKPGEVTAVIEQASAIIIFKLEGRETPSLEKSKDEITQILVKRHLDQQEQARNKSVRIDYNEKYIGSSPTSGWMPASQLNATSNDPKTPVHKGKPQK